MSRPRLPDWFDKTDGDFFREHITKEVWDGMIQSYNHEALKAECKAKGIPLESVRHYWHKSKHISLFAKTADEHRSNEKIFALLLERLKFREPPSIQYPKQKGGSTCAILNLYDAHLDKIALKAETGKNVSIENNVTRYNQGFDELLYRILENDPELIIYPIGNDFFHANDFSGRTKKGTVIQYLTSPEEAYAIVCDVAVACVEKLAQTGRKIVIPFVKGNHDEDNITILGYWLRKLFAGTSNITFLDNRLQRNYLKYGQNLFGFAHGDKEKSKINDLPLLMAQESAKYWAATKYRKFFCGDLHHNFEYKFLAAKDRPGVDIHFLRSVGANDRWHIDHGWTGIPKSAYAEVWDKKLGQRSQYRVNW